MFPPNNWDGKIGNPYVGLEWFGEKCGFFVYLLYVSLIIWSQILPRVSGIGKGLLAIDCQYH